MGNVILWALGTGLISGGVWVGIVMFQRIRRLTDHNRELLADRQRYLDELEAVHHRVVEMEERLDFTERLLARPPEPLSTPDEGARR